MEDLVRAIVEDEDATEIQIQETVSTLHKVLSNIANNPTELKFRRLKKDNRLVAEKILRSEAACSALLVCGFNDELHAYVLPENEDLDDMTELLALLQSVDACKVSDIPPSPSKVAAPPSGGYPAGAPPSRNGFQKNDAERKRSEHADQLEAVRVSQQTQFANGGGSAAALRANAPEVVAPASPSQGTEKSKDKGPKSAFDFESRQKKIDNLTKANESLQELRKNQREKFKEFQADPDAKNAAMYHQPASAAPGASVGGGWFSNLFGGSRSGSSGEKPKKPSQSDKKPKMKTINDLPKPVQRGG